MFIVICIIVDGGCSLDYRFKTSYILTIVESGGVSSGALLGFMLTLR